MDLWVFFHGIKDFYPLNERKHGQNNKIMGKIVKIEEKIPKR